MEANVIVSRHYRRAFKKLLPLTLISLCLVFFSMCAQQEDQTAQNTTEPKAVTKSNPDTVATQNQEITKIDSTPNTQKPKDSTVVLSFKDLSHVYNYKIVDKYHRSESYYDSVSRVIRIFDKKDSLIQKIYPKLEMTPWYFLDLSIPLRLSRSYITGKNADHADIDNYCGEIVVADLNFDGLEDFATPIGSGADNGPHYAFYIQDTNRRFKLNRYLTENVIWFPTTIVDSLMTFTTTVPCGAMGLGYQTFRYDPAFKKWKLIKHYIIDVTTGKRMKNRF
jgi:hypothetical protein